mgnify:CR=1 FL=1
MNTTHNFNPILSNLGISALNEMQEVSHDAIINENNVLLLSPTGSGKTLAFLLPLFELLQPEILSVQCLILVPSRELGLQIEQVGFERVAIGCKRMRLSGKPARALHADQHGICAIHAGAGHDADIELGVHHKLFRPAENERGL